MKRISSAAALLAAVSLLFVPWPTSGQEPIPLPDDPGAAGKESAGVPGDPRISLRVPLYSPAFEKVPVAEVNGNPIPLQEFGFVLASFHAGKTDPREGARIDYGQVLERLINVKLVGQEAEKIGLDELPEVKAQVDAFSTATRRQLLIQNALRESNVRPREEEIEKIYRENVREYRIRSVLFGKEEDARKMEEEIRGGKGFDELADRRIDDGAAKGSKEPDTVRLGAGKLQPAVAQAVAGTAAGSTSSVIRVKDGFVILKVEDILYPEDPGEREKAAKKATAIARGKALDEYKAGLVRKYAKPDRKLIERIDFSAKKPGFENLLKDKRVAVRIQGGKDVTVGEWARAIREKFYHGVTPEDSGRKISRKKLQILDEIVEKRVLDREALAKGIDKSDEYKARVGEFRDSLVFGMFLEKVVAPDVTVSPEEVQAYYDRHAAEFRYPEMARIDGLAFGKLQDAEDALGKLQKGSDFKWMKENAEGQVPADAPGRLDFKGDIVMTASLPEDVQKTVTGGKPGDLRIHASPEGYVYVLQIREMVPSRVRPLEEVRDIVTGAVYNQNFDRNVEEWFVKLRKAGDVRTYLAKPDAK